MSNTYVSNPGGTAPTAAPPGPPGGGVAGANMSMTSAVLWLVGGLAGIGVGTAYLARKGIRPEIGRFDALDAVWNAASVGVIFGTFKLLAYRYHGHELSQAVLLLL